MVPLASLVRLASLTVGIVSSRRTLPRLVCGSQCSVQMDTQRTAARGKLSQRYYATESTREVTAKVVWHGSGLGAGAGGQVLPGGTAGRTATRSSD